jgi:O-antigen/teichoic acid export membrane protein
MKFFRDVSTTFAATILTFFLAITASIIIARVLQPAGKGEFTTIRTSAEFAMAIASVGIGKSLTYYIGRDQLDRATLMRTGLGLCIAEGILATLIFVVLLLLVSNGAGVSASSGALVLLVALPIPFINAMNNWAGGYLRGRQQIFRINMATVLRFSFYAVWIAMLSLVGLLTPLTAILGGMLGAIVMFGVYTIGLAREHVPKLPALNWTFTQTLVTYGFTYQVCSALQDMHYRIDILLVASYLGDIEVGYYSLSLNTGQLIWQLPQAIGLVMLPYLASIQNSEHSIERTAAVARIATFFIVTSAIGLGLVAGWLVPFVYSDAYEPSVMPLRLLLPGIITGGLLLVLGSHFLVQQKQLQFIGITGTSLVLNLGLNVWAIPQFGIYGAAVVSSITATLMYSASVLYIAHTTAIPVHHLVVPNRTDIAQLIAVVRRAGTAVQARLSGVQS